MMSLTLHTIINVKNRRKQALYGYQINRLMNQDSKIEPALKKPPLDPVLPALPSELGKLRGDVENDLKQLQISYKKTFQETRRLYLEEKNISEMREKEITVLKETIELLKDLKRENAILIAQYSNTLKQEKAMRQHLQKELVILGQIKTENLAESKKHAIDFAELKNNYLKQTQEKTSLENSLKTTKNSLEETHTKYMQEKTLRKNQEKDLEMLKQDQKRLVAENKALENAQYMSRSHLSQISDLERKNIALTKSLNDAKFSKPKTANVDLESARKLGYAQGLFYAIDEYGSDKTFDRQTAEYELKNTFQKLQEEQQLYKSIGEDFSTLHKNLLYKINMKIFNAGGGGNVSNTIRSTSTYTQLSSTLSSFAEIEPTRSKSYKINEYRNMQKFLNTFPSYDKTYISDEQISKLILIQGRVQLDANNHRETDKELKAFQEKLLESVKFELRHVTDTRFRKCAALDIDTEHFGKTTALGYYSAYSEFGI